MVPNLDIFRIESNGVLWCGAVTSVETAQDQIQKLAHSSPGSYLILDQKTTALWLPQAPLHETNTRV
jgi:hypothetical protein